MSTPTHSRALSGDFWGGLAAMLVALPSAIAYGVAAYADLGHDYVAFGAMSGLLGTVILGLIAPALGGAPRLITAPCAPAAALLAALIVRLLAGDIALAGPFPPERILLLVTTVGVLAATLQFLFGAMGGGRIIKYIPFPVVSGYLSGVGLIIFLGQIPKLMGFPKGTDPWHGLTDPSLWNKSGIVVGVVTIVGMLFGPRLTKVLPAPILGLIAGMTVYFALALPNPELRQLTGNALLIGPVSFDFHTMLTGLRGRWDAMGQFHFADIAALIVPALTLAALLSIDTLKTCVIVDTITLSRHRSNRELMAQGLGNLATNILGGMPGAGTMGATLININSGGTTRLSGIFAGGFSLAALLLFGTLIGWVPVPALAGVLMVVAGKMVDWHSFHLLRQRSTLLDFVVIVAVIVVAVRFNLIAASGTGVALAVLLFLREQVKSSVIRRRLTGVQVSSKRHRLPAEKEILAAHGQSIVVCELQGNLFFGTTDQLYTHLEPDIPNCDCLILDMRNVYSVDFTAVHMLEHIQGMLHERGAAIAFSELPRSVHTGRDLGTYFTQTGLVEPTGNLKLFPTLDQALEWAEDRLIDKRLAVHPDEKKRPLALEEIELLRGIKEENELLGLMQQAVEERSYAAGETIFRLGDDGDKLYLIRRGAVRILLPELDGRSLTLAIFGRGNFFGDMAFLDRGKRSTDAVADGATDVFLITRQRFEELIRTHPVLGQKIYARLARALAVRLRYTNAELLALRED
ncbi:MAG: SLC26A/SulP transporter family protein [Magnetococcales bacterium]|nr:SLC26A/SulP transporter family protein [Magnetococcales bacterium]